MTIARTIATWFAIGLPLLVACASAPTESTGTSDEALCSVAGQDLPTHCTPRPPPTAVPKPPAPAAPPTPAQACASLGTSCSTSNYNDPNGIAFEPQPDPNVDPFLTAVYAAGCTPFHLIDLDPTRTLWAYTMCPISAEINPCGNMTASFDNCEPLTPCDRCTGPAAPGWMWVVFNPSIFGSPSPGCSSGACGHNAG